MLYQLEQAILYSSTEQSYNLWLNMHTFILHKVMKEPWPTEAPLFCERAEWNTRSLLGHPMQMPPLCHGG